MLKHTAKLIDPDADAVVAALTQTTAAANKRCRARLLDDDPAKWRKFAQDAAARPEGYAMFRGGRGGVPATQVLAAWWTDAIGRKHVVVRGRRVEHDEAKRLLQKNELDARSPLWHAYPEYVCRRTMNDVEQVVCACGCGAVGTPDSLSWMGETCGPCFDRREELGAAGLRENLPGVLYGDREPLHSVACSPDGTRVAAREGQNRVSYWDIPKRTRTTMAFGNPVQAAAITSDARHLLVCGLTQLIGAELMVFDLATDPPAQREPEHQQAGAVLNVFPLPTPDLVLAQVYDPETGRGRVEVLRVPSGERVRGTELDLGSGRCALSPDGTRFVRGGFTGVTLDVERMRRTGTFDGDVPALAFSHDGERVFVCDRTLRALDAGTGVVRAESRHRGPGYFRYVIALATDPAGAFIYLGGVHGRLLAFTADTLALRAEFDWHLGPVFDLAVSADGSRLFSAGGDGCVKVWPIRDLLRDG